MKSATPDSGRPLSSQCANALLCLAVYAGISHLEVLHMFVSQLSEDTPVRLFVVHCSLSRCYSFVFCMFHGTVWLRVGYEGDIM